MFILTWNIVFTYLHHQVLRHTAIHSGSRLTCEAFTWVYRLSPQELRWPCYLPCPRSLRKGRLTPTGCYICFNSISLSASLAWLSIVEFYAIGTRFRSSKSRGVSVCIRSVTTGLWFCRARDLCHLWSWMPLSVRNVGMDRWAARYTRHTVDLIHRSAPNIAYFVSSAGAVCFRFSFTCTRATSF